MTNPVDPTSPVPTDGPVSDGQTLNTFHDGIPSAPPETAETWMPSSAPVTMQAVARPSFSPAGYEVLEELGCGGMGVVYKARQQGLGRLVALKMILHADHARPADRLRFQREAETLAELRHEHIVQVHEVGEFDGKPFMSLEYVEGGSLDRQLAGTPLLPQAAAALVRQLSDAMQTAHDRGIIHRDLKPANVLLTQTGTPKITDFGLARKQDAEGLSVSGAVLGTPSYMAPEQAHGKGREVDARADVYALGAILYECLTGRPPFRAAKPMHTLLQVISDDPVPPSQLQSRTPRDLETICLKCLHKEPARRYASARELADDLGRFLRGEPVQARPVSRIERGWRWCLRNKAVASLLALVVVVLAGGIAVSTTFGLIANVEANRARDQEDIAIKQRNSANDQRTRAEKLAGELGTSLKAVQAEKKRVQEQLALAEFREYKLPLRLAQEAIGRGEMNIAQNFLSQCSPRLQGWEHDYLLRQTLPRLVCLGHTDDVTSVACSPNGKLIVSGSDDNTVRLWDAETGRAIRTFKGHTSAVTAVAFSPDSKRVAAAARDALKVWDVATGQEAISLKDNPRNVACLAYSPDGTFLAGGDDHAVKVWDATTGMAAFTLKGHTDSVSAVAFFADSKRIASASADNTVRLWNVGTAKEFLILKGHSQRVGCVAISPDGKRIVSGSDDRTIKVWDATSGQESLSLKGQTDIVHSVSFSPDGKRIASGSGDHTVRVWDAVTGQEILTFSRHTAPVRSVVFSTDGRYLVSGSQDKTLNVWDVSPGREALTIQGHTQAVSSLAFSPDGKSIVSGSGDRTLKVWDAATGRDLRTLHGHTEDVTSAAFSPDGKRIVSASEDKTVRVWDAATGKTLRVIEGHSGFVTSMAWSPDGKWIASGSVDRTVKVWDAATGQEVHALKGHRASVSSVTFSADGKQIVSGSWDKTVRVWDAATGQETLSMMGHTATVTDVACSPDGKHIASASQDRTIKLWEAATGKEVVTLQGHLGSVLSVVFFADGTRLTSGSEDGTVKVWVGKR